MLKKILLCEIKGLEPAGKYLLARLAPWLGKCGSITLTVRELAKRFDLPAAHVSDALAALVASRVLACAEVPDGKGRPKKRYSFQERFLQKIEKVELPLIGRNQWSSAAQHEAVIGRLLAHENRVRGEAPKEREDAREELAGVRSQRSPGGLTTVNRVLLSVLLVHSDRFGVVRDLGSAELRKATGLEAESLKHRVHRLISQGLIRAYVPGATGRVIFGKAKSIFFVNLHHSELSGICPEATVLVRKAQVGRDDFARDEAYALFDWALRFSKREPLEGSPIDRTEQFLQIKGFFPAREGRRIAPVLQSRLEHYASSLLSECWKHLSEDHLLIPTPPADLMPGLMERIETEIFPPPKGVDKAEKEPCSPDQLLLVRYLFEEAFRIASQVKCLFLGTIDIPFESMDYLILSRRSFDGVGDFVTTICTVLSLPKDQAAGLGCYVVVPGAELKRYNVEVGIPLKERFAYGLLTKAAAP